MLPVLALLPASLPCAADLPQLAGRWRLEPALSTDPADELEGIRASKKKPPGRASRAPAAPGRSTERRYWEEANAGREWHLSKELAHAGPLQRLLESDILEIVTDGDAWLFVYADGFERPVRPNPDGRVFTASGDELVETEIGFTLAYEDDAGLVLETRIEGGGELRETLSMASRDSLTVDIEIDRRDWKRIARLKRIFVRAGDDPGSPAP